MLYLVNYLCNTGHTLTRRNMNEWNSLVKMRTSQSRSTSSQGLCTIYCRHWTSMDLTPTQNKYHLNAELCFLIKISTWKSCQAFDRSKAVCQFGPKFNNNLNFTKVFAVLEKWLNFLRKVEPLRHIIVDAILSSYDGQREYLNVWP